LGVVLWFCLEDADRGALLALAEVRLDRQQDLESGAGQTLQTVLIGETSGSPS
jgi:hypothetical protein